MAHAVRCGVQTWDGLAGGRVVLDAGCGRARGPEVAYLDDTNVVDRWAAGGLQVRKPARRLRLSPYRKVNSSFQNFATTFPPALRNTGMG